MKGIILVGGTGSQLFPVTKGAVRGLHYQLAPFSHTKLVYVIKGIVLDLNVDIRKYSPTFGKHISHELNDQNHHQLFIPRGYAHRYISFSDESIFHYKVDNFHNKSSIAFDDPKPRINWKSLKYEFIISEKDQNHPVLDKAMVLNYNINLYG